MKTLRKLLVFLLILTISFSLVSCKGQREPSSSGSSPADSSPVDTSPDEPVTPSKTQDEFIDALTSTQFADPTLTEDMYGLSNPAVVGVDQSTYNDCLYPMPDDGEFDQIISFAEYETDSTDNYDIFMEIFEEIKQLGSEGKKVKLKLPGGEIRVSSAKATTNYTFALDGFNGLYIEGNDTVIVIDYEGFTYKGFMYISNSTDVHVEGISLDYAIPTVLSGVITASDEEKLTITVSVYEEFNPLIERIQQYSARIQSVVQFSSITNAPAQGGNFALDSSGHISGYTVEGNATDGYSLTVKFSGVFGFNKPPKGDYLAIAFSMYSFDGFYLTGCKNIHFENVNLYTCPGMGLVVRNSENLFVNRFRIAIKEGTNRLMTATADGMHFDGNTGEVKVTNCLIENTHDDALNVKAGYWYIHAGQDIVGKTITLNRLTSPIPLPEAGDVLEFYDEQDFSYRGKLTVVSAEGDGWEYTIKVKESLVKLNMINWGKTRVTNTSLSPKFEFSNNIVRNKRNRGILCQLRNAVIRNNTFENVGHGAISIHSSLDKFNEATMPRDVTIENNKLIGNNHFKGLEGDIAVFAITTVVAPKSTILGIKVKNNFIADTGNAAVSFRGVGDSEINDNLFVSPSQSITDINSKCAVELNNAANVTLAGNYHVRTGDTYDGIIPTGTTDVKEITLTDNYNLKFQNLDYENPVYNVKKIATDVLTVDGSLGDWADVGLDVEIVGYSLASGDEINKAELDSTFEVRACKIAWSENGIYLGMEVFDKAFDFKTPSDFWYGDCIELFFTSVLDMPNADLQSIKNMGAAMQMAMVPTWSDGFALVGSRTTQAIWDNRSTIQAKCKVTESGDGYIGEAFLPFTALADMKEKIDAGSPLAMAFIFADTGNGRQRVQAGNVEHFVEAWKTKTARMPRYMFVD